jgi:hypothetical protein
MCDGVHPVERSVRILESTEGLNIMARRKTKSGIPGVKGKRTEGTLLAAPVERKTPKSDFLLKLEARQVQAQVATVTKLRR